MLAKTIREEYIKCYKDKTREYFIEHYLTTFNGIEGKETPFILFPRQKAFLESLAANSNTVAIKPRQAGITTVSSAWTAGQIVFASKDSPETVLCIGNKLSISQQLLTKVCNFIDKLPRWFWGPEYYSSNPKDPRNMKSLYVQRNKSDVELFNGCKIHARSSGENAARGVPSVSILILDEAAFIQNSLSTYSSAVASTSACPYARIIMVSTPNGKDQLYYQIYKDALAGKNNYHAVEFQWYQDPRYNRFMKWYRKNPDTGKIEIQAEPVIDKKGNIPYDEEKWGRLKREGWEPDSPWYKKMCKSFNNDSIRIAQELDVSFEGSDNSVVPPDVIEAQKNQNVIELPEGWHLYDPLVKDIWIWKKPEEGHRYVLSIDPSSGSGDDSTAMEMLDIDAVDGQGKPFVDQVLEYNGKMVGNEVGELAYIYGSMYNNALIVVDCIGGYGDPVVLTLMEKKYPNLYYDDPTLKTYTVQKQYADLNVPENEKLPGYHTSGCRVQCIGNFISALKTNAFRVRSIRIINELQTWIWKRGRIDHKDGYHDDTLTCTAMGLFVMQFSLLRRETEKKKDTYILKSWVSTRNIDHTDEDNKLSQGTYDAKTQTIQMSDGTRKTFPFFGYDEKDDKQRRFNAMLMIGGYKASGWKPAK